MRAQLALADDDTLSAYADAVAISEELGIGAEPGAATDRTIVSIDSARQARRWRTPAVAAAAAAAAVAILVFRTGRTPEAYSPREFASAVSVGARAMDGPVWSATRGGTDGLSDQARAARVGALLTDLELDGIRGDTARIRADASALATLLANAASGGFVATPFRELASAPAIVYSAQRVREIGRQAISVVDGPFADAGAYLEAARVAAAAHDISFFDRVPDSALSKLDGDQRLDTSTKSALATIRALTGTRSRDATAIHLAVDTLLRALTR